MELDPAEHRVRSITERLRECGWSRDEAAERSDWPDFEYRNGLATLQLFHPPGYDWISLSLLTEDKEGQLKVVFGDRLDAVLDVVTAAQDRLGPDGWVDFIEDLLMVPATVYACRGEDGGDQVELVSLRA